MTSADTETMTALQELLDERQRYQGWLTVLEQRRASTPAHVYDRVHTDYSLRLERVTERLSERAEQLGGTIDALSARLSALRARESERSDARHEAELRAIVGEYSPDDWERLRSVADRELSEIAVERKALESEIAEMERIVALARENASADGNTERATERDVPAGATTGVDDTSLAAPSAQAEMGNQDHGGGSEAAPSIDEFVAKRPANEADGADHGNAAGSAEAQSHRDGVAEVREGQGDEVAAPAGAQGSSTPQQATRAAELSAVTAGLGRPAAPGSRPTPPAGADIRRESEKTLKCPECGVLNYATEWYCERCGGELSTF